MEHDNYLEVITPMDVKLRFYGLPDNIIEEYNGGTIIDIAMIRDGTIMMEVKKNDGKNNKTQ